MPVAKGAHDTRPVHAPVVAVSGGGASSAVSGPADTRLVVGPWAGRAWLRGRWPQGSRRATGAEARARTSRTTAGQVSVTPPMICAVVGAPGVVIRPIGMGMVLTHRRIGPDCKRFDAGCRFLQKTRVLCTHCVCKGHRESWPGAAGSLQISLHRSALPTPATQSQLRLFGRCDLSINSSGVSKCQSVRAVP